MKNFLLLFLLFIFNLEAKELTIIPEHSSIAFDIPFMKLSSVEGKFEKINGDFFFDAEKNVLKDVQITIDLKSLNTADKKRDFHLKGPDFFHVLRFPEAKFAASSAHFISRTDFILNGKLTLKEQVLSLQLKGKFLGKIQDHQKKDNYFFTAETILDRTKFGIHWNKSIEGKDMLIGNLVKLSIKIQAQLPSKKTAYSSFMITDNKALKNRAQFETTAHPSIIENSKTVAPLVTITENKIQNVKLFDWSKAFLGLLGFIPILFLSFQLKQKAQKKTNDQTHDESNFQSFVGDGLVIIVNFLYSIFIYWWLFS